ALLSKSLMIKKDFLRLSEFLNFSQLPRHYFIFSNFCCACLISRSIFSSQPMKTLIYLGFIAVAAITIVSAAELSSQNNGPTELAQVNLEILKAKVQRLERKT